MRSVAQCRAHAGGIGGIECGESGFYAVIPVFVEAFDVLITDFVARIAGESGNGKWVAKRFDGPCE